MDNSNIVSPPEVNMKGIRGGFWKQLGMLVLGTTVSLVLTFGTAQIIEKKQRANDRRLTALMVMSNIESFAQQLDTAWSPATGHSMDSGGKRRHRRCLAAEYTGRFLRRNDSV